MPPASRQAIIPWRDDPRTVRPMLAVSGGSGLDPTRPPELDPRLWYEPKYDGMRALVEVQPARAVGGSRRTASRQGSPTVRIWSRAGRDKTAAFPDVAAALAALGQAVGRAVLLDGEIVAVDEAGEPLGFQKLQARLHLTAPRQIHAAAARQRAAFIAFDLLRDGDEDLRPLPLAARRARLERLLARPRLAGVRVSEVARGADAATLLRRVLARGGEGLVAKDPQSPYETGRRSPAWRKIKVVRRQECVVGGWTEPRRGRKEFGALLLGVWPTSGDEPPRAGVVDVPRTPARGGQPASGLSTRERRLVYVGHVGTGFSGAELARLGARLRSLETRVCPFTTPPATNERPHWVRPLLVVEVQFAEWTEEGRLRAPVFLGVRDDVPPAAVRVEAAGEIALKGARARLPLASPSAPAEYAAVFERLQELEDRGRDGRVALPDGHSVRVTNLRKLFWRDLGITKGALLRYYAAVAPYLLPVVADRPLVMERFPDGVGGESFYQQRAPDPVPAGVRVAVVEEHGERLPRLVGGSLTTLLYMVQLGTISQDPWFSRVESPDEADFAAFDLDPMPDVRFRDVLDVARWIRDELDRLGVTAVAKTSGNRGLHIYVPLPPSTPYDAALLFCQLVATLVAARHPRLATVERALAARGRRVYIDCLQNRQGKTLAAAYSARANAFAGVSTPLSWEEVADGVDPRDFTLRTIAARLEAVGDLWAALRTARPADLEAALRKVTGRDVTARGSRGARRMIRTSS